MPGAVRQPRPGAGVPPRASPRVRGRPARAGGRRAARWTLQLLDAARVGVEHLELDARWMAHELAARRHAPDDREHQAAERVDVLLLVGVEQLDAEVRLELLDGRARGGDEAELGVGR